MKNGRCRQSVGSGESRTRLFGQATKPLDQPSIFAVTSPP